MESGPLRRILSSPSLFPSFKKEKIRHSTFISLNIYAETQPSPPLQFNVLL
jgi:hypothetical protein